MIPCESLLELDCKFLTSTWTEETVTGCCDGRPTLVTVGNCALYGRCTIDGAMEDTHACLGCDKQESK